jgi:hypothetical protein
VEQKPGGYAGAAFLEPVAFDCKEGQIPAGDWSRYGLQTYPGAAVYGTSLHLQGAHLQGRVYLDCTAIQNTLNRLNVKSERPFSTRKCQKI